MALFYFLKPTRPPVLEASRGGALTHLILGRGSLQLIPPSGAPHARWKDDGMGQLWSSRSSATSSRQSWQPATAFGRRCRPRSCSRCRTGDVVDHPAVFVRRIVSLRSLVHQGRKLKAFPGCRRTGALGGRRGALRPGRGRPGCCWPSWSSSSLLRQLGHRSLILS